MKLHDSITISGRLHIEVLQDSKVTKIHNHNMIMTAGREMLAQLVTGNIKDSIMYIGIGSGTAEETPEDTGLQDECQVPLTVRSVVDNARAKFEFEIGKEAGNGINVREFGLFSERGTMFSHYVRPASAEDLKKAEDMVIKGYWIINF